MKDKIITFFVGLFLGAIISTASIYVYTKANNNQRVDNMNNMGEMMPGKMENGNEKMDEQGNSPEMPDGDKKFEGRE